MKRLFRMPRHLPAKLAVPGLALLLAATLASAEGLDCAMCHADGLKIDNHPVPTDAAVELSQCTMCHAMSATTRPVDKLFVAIHEKHTASAGLDCGACHAGLDAESAGAALDDALKAARGN